MFATPALHQTWTENHDGTTIYAETFDPRVLAIIQADPYPDVPEGDGYAPAYYLEYQYGWGASRAGAAYRDAETDAAADGYASILNHFHDHHDAWRIAERYLRIFHGVETALIEHHTGIRILLLDAPTYLAHIGCASCPSPSNLYGDELTWKAYLDNEVYSVGYAVNPGRLSRTIPATDPTEPENGWNIEITCSTFYGLPQAQYEAAWLDHGVPILPTLLDADSTHGVFA